MTEMYKTLILKYIRPFHILAFTLLQEIFAQFGGL